MSAPVSKFRSFLRNLTGRAVVERDLSDEVTSFVDLATARNMRSGLNEAEARRQAVLELGGVEQVKEQVREVQLGHFLEMRLQDVRFAFRTLRKSPIFSVTVALVLALGIGSTCLMFAIVNSVLLKGAPFPEANRLFMLLQDLPQEKRVSFSTREFSVWQKQTAVFANLAALTGTSFTVTGRGEPEQAAGQRVTTSFFQTLRAQPEIGRVFLESEGVAGHEQVAILSHRFWQEHFGLRSDVLGQSVILNGEPHTVVGVMPEGFDFPRREVQVWVPAPLDGPLFQQNLDAHFLRVIGRLKPGGTPDRLRAEMALLGTRVNAPDDETVRKFYAISLNEMIAGDLRKPLLVLLGAVAFLLLIACANVANLMLARVGSRQGEMAVRSALGASRRRLIAQLLTEAALLATVGGAVGIAIAIWGLDLLRGLAAENFPELLRAHVDGWTLGFAFAITIVSGVLMGLAPALAATRPNFQEALKSATRSTSCAGAERTRHGLVFAEVAFACVLLVGCGLMMRSFIALVHAEPGFRALNVITANAVISDQQYPEPADMMRFYRTSLAAVRGLPGAESTGIVTHLPFGGNGWGNGYEVEGQPAPAGVEYSAQIRPISPDYLATLAIPLRLGRAFTDYDKEDAPGVAIVNQLFADRFWPNESPLGQRIRYMGDWLSIVGVCGNIKHSQLDGESDLEIYVPYPQLPPRVITFVGRQLNYVVRSSAPANIAPQLRGAIRAIDPGLVVDVNTMEALIDESIAQPRFRTWLIGIVSVFALTLACLGIYGVIAYLVTQRSKEIGIRLALGASRSNILGLILRQTVQLAAAGIVAGMVASFFLVRFLATILFGITVHDPLTFIAVPAALLVVALIAGYLPARRAMRVDPVTSLRYE